MKVSNEDRQRRMLDLLAGWAEYVAAYAGDTCSCEDKAAHTVDRATYESELNHVHALYQHVGRQDADAFDLTAAMREIGNIIRTGETSEEVAK